MKKTIAVFFGGRSPEHDISIVTALSSVIRPLLLTKRYTVVPVYITKQGKWVGGDSLLDIATFRSHKIDAYIKKAKPIAITFDGGFVLDGKSIDVAFPAMHGSYGEDGSLMGLLRLSGVPFVGADMDASVIAMDKVLAKQVAKANAIATSAFVFTTRKAFLADQQFVTQDIAKNLNFPLFVKPAHLGSSIGISRVENSDQLHNALEVAAHYDDKIIVEEAVENLIEVTVPIIGNDEPVPAVVERPLAQGDSFFDFETKYLRGGGKKAGGIKSAQGYSELPAVLPGTLYTQSVETALAVYAALGLSGIARVDLLINSKTKKVYFNEVNPLPGSLYAHNWRAAGVTGISLVERLIGYAEERFESQKNLNTTFDSSFLQQF